MIQPKELRIGNYVNVFDKIDEIKSIDENEHGGFCKFKNNPYQYYLCHNGEALIKPIILTEEILLKFGFSSRGTFWLDLYLDEKTKFTLGWHLDGRIDFEISINKIYFDISHIKHIHQLQNLFYSLTGEELTFKN